MFIQALRQSPRTSRWATWVIGDQGAAATETRQFLSVCFDRLGQADQRTVINRTCSADATGIDSLIHELVSHELLCRLGLKPTVEPQVGGLTPDFAVLISGTKFLVDVFVANNPSRTIVCKTEAGLGTVDCGDRAKKISDRLAEKSIRYGKIGLPFIAIVFLGDHQMASHNIVEAFYGASLDDGNLLDDYPSYLAGLKTSAGLTLPDDQGKPRHQNISAVLACDWFDTGAALLEQWSCVDFS